MRKPLALPNPSFWHAQQHGPVAAKRAAELLIAIGVGTVAVELANLACSGYYSQVSI
jgi:hypothetical protein